MFPTPATAPQMTRQTPPLLSLLDLPRELRDQIYDEVFKAQEMFELSMPINAPSSMSIDSGFRTPNEHCSTSWKPAFQISYPSPVSTQPVNLQRGPQDLQWMRTNKQICHEAIELFQRQSTWSITREPLGNSSMVGRWSNRTNRRRTTLIGPALFVPNDARNIIVPGPLLVTERCELNDRGKAAWFIYVDGGGVLPCLSSRLTDSAKLQKLSLTLHTSWRPLDSPLDTPVKVSFGHLNRLIAPDLRKVEFAVQYHDSFLARPDYILALEGSISETGVDLVGGEGTMARRTVNTSPHITMYTCTRKSP